MSRTALFARLAAKDLRKHRSEALLLAVVIAVASATLTVGLVLHGVTSNPYATTRAATKGPDVVAALASPYVNNGSGARNANPAGLSPLEHARGVTGSSGPYPVTFALLSTRGITAGATVEGRGSTPAAVDRPELEAGTWVRPGGVVVERSFADALGVRAGDTLTLNGSVFHVAGIAVDAALPASNACDVITCPSTIAGTPAVPTGLIWATRADATRLASPGAGLSYVLNLGLASPGQAPGFVASHAPSSASALSFSSWQDIAADDAVAISGAQTVLLAGSVLLIVLAIASVVVLVAGRMAEQTRRVGLLKVVGGTPGTVAVVLLLEHLAVTLVAAVAGLCIGRLVAPLLTSPGGGLIGTPNAPPVSASTFTIVIGVALAIALSATLLPAVRAARTSTIDALADAPRLPRRNAALVSVTSHLPAVMLLALRLAGRRPRRLALGTLSVAVAVAGLCDAVIARVQEQGGISVDDLQHQRIDQVLLVITVMLLVLAAVNALLITWATVLDSRRTTALAQSFGATPRQVGAGLAVTQFLAVFPGSVLGIPLGIGIFALVKRPGAHWVMPAPWWFILVVAGTWILMTALALIPARIGERRSVAETLQAVT
jgi:putative ABC transport system permease protein